MHTKGESAKQLREDLQLDTCIYLGNDLNDITMFSNAIDDDDFIVIASHEDKKITNMVVRYLKEECKIKGKKWEDIRLVVLKEENVNDFLNKMNKIMNIVSGKRKDTKGIRGKYKVNIRQQNKTTNQQKKTMKINRRRIRNKQEQCK